MVGAERLGRRDLALLDASALRGRRLDTQVGGGVEGEAGRAGGEGADRVLADTGGASGEEGAGVASGSAVGDWRGERRGQLAARWKSGASPRTIRSVVDRGADTVVELVAALASRGVALGRHALGARSARERAGSTAATAVKEGEGQRVLESVQSLHRSSPVVHIARNVAAEVEVEIEIEEVVAGGGAAAEEAPGGSSIAVARGANVADLAAIVGVGEEVDGSAGSRLESVGRVAGGVGAATRGACTLAEREGATIADLAAVVDVRLDVHRGAGAIDELEAGVAGVEGAGSRGAGSLAVGEAADVVAATAVVGVGLDVAAGRGGGVPCETRSESARRSLCERKAEAAHSRNRGCKW